MNVTILVPPNLRSAMDGRETVELGVPATSGVGEVMEVLLQLYPKLRAHLANERKASTSQLHLFLPEQAGGWRGASRAGLRDGQRLYLFAASPKRISAEVV
jgi:hypothetical protein